MGPNQHIEDYLSYYLGFSKSPHFAVLVNGPWGIGKTFIVKRFLEQFEKKKFRHVYISLYGLTSFDEIDDALFRAIYPLLYRKDVQLAGRAVKAIAKHLHVDVDLEIKDVLSNSNVDVYLFDDIERCGMPINSVLGYINEFVEHEGRKVIIIANEKEVKEGEDYRRIREKLVGKTLEVQSEFGSALEAFIESMQDDRTKTFITSKADVISEVYHQSKLHNLRILQQSIWDFERLYVVLDDKYRGSEVAMTALLGLLFALSFELKAARLDIDDLFKRQSTMITALMRARREEGKPPRITMAQERYCNVDLGSSILSDESLVDLLIKGVVVVDQIHRELDSSSYFVKVADEPSWRTVWYAFERTEEEFSTSLAKMERAFGAREFAVPGEILHILGLRIWLSKIGAIQKTLDDVLSEGKSYIDGIFSKDNLDLTVQREYYSEMRHTGYGGLGFYEESTSEFQQLFTYLMDKIQTAKVSRYPVIAAELLDNMKADPALFSRRITLRNDVKSEYHDTPVLASLDPAKFATLLLRQHPADQRKIMNALHARYDHDNLARWLEEERAWATEVRNCLFAMAADLSPISKHRVRQNLENTLDEVLGLGTYSQPTAGEDIVARGRD
ncbi:MAG: P-loop NTPase fold protein [Reyranellaceae bacterium]